MLSNDQIVDIVQEFYTDDPKDLLGIFAIARLVEDTLGTDVNVLENTLCVVELLLSKGMVAGSSPYDLGGSKPWRYEKAGEVLNRIRSEWLQRGEPPNIPDAPWFGATNYIS